MVKFELKQSIFVLTPQDSDASWFGVSVRFGYLPWLGGYTVYVRKNGILEVARIQDFKIIDTRQLKALEYDAAYTLHVIIDGNYLKAWLDGSDADFIEATDLENQEYGNVSLSNFQTTTEILSSDTVSRDTLNFK